MLRLLWQELIFRRNSIIGWGLGLCFFPLVYVSIYPSFEAELESMQAFLDLEIYKAMGITFATFEDWVASTIILFVPLVAAIFAVINATGTLAGEEADGRLEMVVVLPIPRWQIVTVKAIALTIALLLILLIVGLVSMGVFWAIESQITTVINAGDIMVALLGAYPLTLAMGMISLFLAAFCPSRRVASMIGIAILLISYFGSNLAGMAEPIEPFEPLFLFTYLDISGNILVNGPEFSDILVLLAVAVVSFGLAVLFFQRRDITVGQWPWQRARAA